MMRLLDAVTIKSATEISRLDLTTIAAAEPVTNSGPLEIEPALHHNKITFEIPSHRDLEHINTLHNFNTLLQRIGNVAYDSVASGIATNRQHPQYPSDALSLNAGAHAGGAATITREQISKSAVLDLADLKSGTNGLERFFSGADMHSIINYLWIGVVTSLVILSVIFVIFSCYFYRKFREWKKCNKDIRSQMHDNMYPGGVTRNCGSLMNSNETATEGAAYYQMEAPPCYTIATGLPTYAEALHHQQHFSYGVKFVYPTIAAVHHHPAMSGTGADLGTAFVLDKSGHWQKPSASAQIKGGSGWQQSQTKKADICKVTAVDMTLPAYGSVAVTESLNVLTATTKTPEAISVSIEAPPDVLTKLDAGTTKKGLDDANA